MSAQRLWLIDKSAYVRLGGSPDAQDWAARIERGLVSAAAATVLEIGYSSQSAEDWERLVLGPPVSGFPMVHLTPTMELRAIEIQRLLAQRGQHRAPSVPDLLIAAAAEASKLVVLHDDKDFELIAEVTRQPIERLRT